MSLLIEENKIIRFALNYRAYIKEKWCEIYRVDNFHGFLHEQKFWRSKKPILLQDKGSVKDIIKSCLKELEENFKKYRSYYEKNK